MKFTGPLDAQAFKTLQPPVNPLENKWTRKAAEEALWEQRRTDRDLTLGDYIQRKERAYSPLPEPVVIDKRAVEHAITALEHSNPYVASVLRSALDKGTTP